MTSMSRYHLHRGLRVGAIPVIVGLVTLYVVLAPTHDIRSRLPHLMAGVGPLVLVFLALLILALGILVATGSINRSSIAGAAISAGLGTGALEVGGFSTVAPEITQPTLGWLLVGATLAAAAGSMWIERRREREQ